MSAEGGIRPRTSGPKFAVGLRILFISVSPGLVPGAHPDTSPPWPDGIIAAYIMANRKNGAIYTGVTSDLARRAYEHREGALEGVTKRYGCKRLVWFEPHALLTAAMQRERTMKHYLRAWKVNLIEAVIRTGWTSITA